MRINSMIPHVIKEKIPAKICKFLVLTFVIFTCACSNVGVKGGESQNSTPHVDYYGHNLDEQLWYYGIPKEIVLRALAQFSSENPNCKIDHVILDSEYGIDGSIVNDQDRDAGNNKPPTIYIDVHKAHIVAIANASEPNNPDEYLSEVGLAIKDQIASQKDYICR